MWKRKWTNKFDIEAKIVLMDLGVFDSEFANPGISICIVEATKREQNVCILLSSLQKINV